MAGRLELMRGTLDLMILRTLLPGPSHGHAIAKGADPTRMMLELFGKEGGICSGKGGSMHLADFDKGIMGANSIVGAAVPLALGAALAASLAGSVSWATLENANGVSSGMLSYARWYQGAAPAHPHEIQLDLTPPLPRIHAVDRPGGGPFVIDRNLRRKLAHRPGPRSPRS